MRQVILIYRIALMDKEFKNETIETTTARMVMQFSSRSNFQEQKYLWKLISAENIVKFKPVSLKIEINVVIKCNDVTKFVNIPSNEHIMARKNCRA